jgi:hypothetical protein
MLCYFIKDYKQQSFFLITPFLSLAQPLYSNLDYPIL